MWVPRIVGLAGVTPTEQEAEARWYNGDFRKRKEVENVCDSPIPPPLSACGERGCRFLGYSGSSVSQNWTGE